MMINLKIGICKHILAAKLKTMLCCPEDIDCKNIVNEIHSREERCEACETPCCQECPHHIFAEEPAMPLAALAHDMIIYYAPTEFHTDNITVMELLCASVCIASMLFVYA